MPFAPLPSACTFTWLVSIRLVLKGTGIDLSPNKRTAITCGLVFGLSSFGESALCSPREVTLLWGWSALSPESGLWADHSSPQPLFLRGAHNPSRAYMPTKRYSVGFLAFGPPLDLVMWGLELRQPLTIRKETSLSLRTAQEGGRAERCKETQFGCYYSNLWIKLQWKPVQSSECLSIWANKPKVIPLKSSSQKQTNNELMLTWHLQS